MARVKTAWGIDIGQRALKALKLREVQGQIEVEQFEVIPHPQILSSPDVDRDQLIRDAIQRFLVTQNVANCHVAVSVPGQATFSRFVKLPPVEAKRIPDIVRFEAEQQIPFPINEVIWRYQTFHDPDSPDIEVGIFAMKKSDVAETLHHFNLAGLRVDSVQVAPLALYNFMAFDGQAEPEGATILADVGADKTDLVIADQTRLWYRTIQIGGNRFTDSLVRTFKLSFDKAEELKLSAASSKYARQIFQAMRPVFADLVQEIQRSLGFYTSLHREARFKKLVGLGNGFRLPGLQKFMEQNLNVNVTRVDEYSNLTLGSSVNAPTFHENVPSLAVAYGLGVQGLGEEKVSTNLLPEEIVRFRLWKKKRPYFVAAAIVLLLAMFLPGYRARQDSSALQDASGLRSARTTIRTISEKVDQWRSLSGQDVQQETAIKDRAKMTGYRNFWPSMMAVIEESVQAVSPDQDRMLDYARMLEYEMYTNPTLRDQIESGRGLNDAESVNDAAAILLGAEQMGTLRQTLAGSDAALQTRARQLLDQLGSDPNSSSAIDANSVAAMSGEALKIQVARLEMLQHIKAAREFKAQPRANRQVLLVEAMDAQYAPDLGAAMSANERAANNAARFRGKPGFVIVLKARTPLNIQNANRLVARLGGYAREYARWYSAVNVADYDSEFGAGAAAAPTRTVVAPPTSPDVVTYGDPLMKEDISKDTRFRITWFVEVAGDGVVLSSVSRMPGQNQYTLSAEAEMFPDFEPADALAAAKKIVNLPAQTKLTVQEIRPKSTVPWYRVMATDAGGKSLGVGWLCGADVDEKLN